MNSAFMKRITLGPDARSGRGMFSRGKAIYGNGTRHAAKSGRTGKQDLNAAIERRLRRGK